MPNGPLQKIRIALISTSCGLPRRGPDAYGPLHSTTNYEVEQSLIEVRHQTRDYQMSSPPQSAVQQNRSGNGKLGYRASHPPFG